MGLEIDCFSLLTSSEMRENPAYRRWMGYAAMLNGTLFIPIQAIGENLLSLARRTAVPIHTKMGISFISVDWVLGQSLKTIEKQAYENMKATALEIYQRRPSVPEVLKVSHATSGTFDNVKDQDAFLDWIYAAPGRASLVYEDPNLRSMEFRTTAMSAHIGPAAYQSLKGYLESIGIDPESRECNTSDWN